MANQLPETENFGFTRFGNGEPLSKNGWAFSDADRVTIDKLFYASLNHTHSGDPALGDPTDGPGLVALPTGGNLPAAVTYYYRVSFVDQWGLETAAGPEGSITTANPIAPPTAPAVSIEATSGSVAPGVYSYMVTFVDLYGGQSTPSPMASAQVLSGAANRIRLDMPELPAGAASINIYRSRPGQTQFYYLGNTATGSFYDVGSSEDQSILAPTVNTTNASNSVQVTIPLAFIPQGCFGWKIYRALSSGGYDGTSLVHWVTEGATDTSTTPRTMWTDTGDGLLSGFPPDKNSSATSGIKLTLDMLSGALPLASMPRGAQVYSTFAPGVVQDQTVVGITEIPVAIQPTRLTAHFKTPVTENGTTVRIRVADSASTPNFVEVASTDFDSGDASGYVHVEWPLYLAETFEAEQGTRSSTTQVAINSDQGASSGQAVALANANDYVQVDLGQLDPGDYQTYFMSRVLQFVNGSTNDLQVAIIRTDTNAVLGTPISYTLTPQTGDSDPSLYLERNGPSFTAPGGVDIVMRVTKAVANAQAYNIDKMRFTATAPVLQPGTITTQTFVDGASTSAADVNVALWF